MSKKALEKFRRYLKGNPLSKNILLYSFGSLGSRAINFAIYPILTFFLLREELGYYDLVVNTIYLVIPLATLQYADGIYRVILPSDDDDHRRPVVSTGINFIALASFLILGLLILSVSFFVPVRYPGWIFLMAFLFGMNHSLKQVARGLKKNKIYVISDILYSLVFILGLSILLLGLKLGLQGVFLAFIAANLLSIFYVTVASGLTHYLKPVLPRLSEMRPILSYSTPLIPNTLSWWLVGSANTYIITIILGLEFNGIYAVGYKISSVIYLLNRVFNLAWQDQLIGDERNDPAYNSRIFNRLILVLLSLAILVILLTKPLLNYVVEDAYFIVWRYVPFLLLAAVFSSLSSYFGAFYLRWQTTRKIFISTLIGAVLAITTSIVLTSLYGLMGTSISVAIGFGAVVIYRFVDTRNELRLKFNPYIPILVLALAGAITLTYFI